MNSMAKVLEYSLNSILAALILLMGVFVFGNVLLRYLFNSGLPWAEELSRFLFVWVTFLGAIEAMIQNKHLGFSSLIVKMPRTVKKLFYLASNLLMLYVLYLLVTGGWAMTKLGMMNRASTTDMPLAWMFGVSLITFPCMIGIVVVNTYRAFFGAPDTIDSLVEMQESEEEVQATEMAKGDEKQ